MLIGVIISLSNIDELIFLICVLNSFSKRTIYNKPFEISDLDNLICKVFLRIKKVILYRIAFLYKSWVFSFYHHFDNNLAHSALLFSRTHYYLFIYLCFKFFLYFMKFFFCFCFKSYCKIWTCVAGSY